MRAGGPVAKFQKNHPEPRQGRLSKTKVPEFRVACEKRQMLELSKKIDYDFLFRVGKSAAPYVPDARYGTRTASKARIETGIRLTDAVQYSNSKGNGNSNSGLAPISGLPPQIYSSAAFSASRFRQHTSCHTDSASVSLTLTLTLVDPLTDHHHSHSHHHRLHLSRSHRSALLR